MQTVFKSIRLSLLVVFCSILTSCWYFNGIPWAGGPYALIWIDDPKKVELAYDTGNGGWSTRIEECVFEVGWDGRYVVAKQHRLGNKNFTAYYYIDSSKDSVNAKAEDVVMGPFLQPEFEAKSKELGLPPFTTLLESLR